MQGSARAGAVAAAAAGCVAEVPVVVVVVIVIVVTVVMGIDVVGVAVAAAADMKGVCLLYELAPAFGTSFPMVSHGFLWPTGDGPEADRHRRCVACFPIAQRCLLHLHARCYR